LDEYSPDSVTILESTSRDTIDSLAMLGYYDQAIAVASGVSSKRQGSLPGGVDLFDDALKYILCTYLVPAATKSAVDSDGGNGAETLQSRSRIAQIRDSSSACSLASTGMQHLQPRCITSSTVNPKSWVPNSQSCNALEATMAMSLLRQYTTVYYERCRGLGLNIADAILKAGEGVSELPLWLKELCMFGNIAEDGNSSGSASQSGLFAQLNGADTSTLADPAGLMRLYIKHHQYGEACDVVTSILTKQQNMPNSTRSSSRLPEKGSIDWIPYNLIDMLWNVIESIVSTHPSNSSKDVTSQVNSLIKMRGGMEKALEKHFEMLKMSEEGLRSARALSCA